MKEGDIVLAIMPQSSAPLKVRPALFLKKLAPFQDILVCGVTTQTHHFVEAFDELLESGDADFQSSGLKATAP
jgi:mRNA interferase MazF